ncbi:MAG: tripartite tricarboxylate transporter substrate binding protein, partial [Betaproteobacteria bacterium]|nr:tripartite tricarboxylate transporter substrate binding protein [Betaproteobacteria bacterium]
LFKIAAGVDIVHVPYKGTAPATIDLLAGNVDMTLSIPTSVLSHIKAGRLRALAVTGSGRIEALPDVPSAMEASLPQLNVLSWYGAVAPAATPPHILDQLNAGFVRALNSPDVRERMKAVGQMPAPSSREEFQRQIRADYEIWGKVVKSANLKAE